MNSFCFFSATKEPELILYQHLKCKQLQTKKVFHLYGALRSGPEPTSSYVILRPLKIGLYHH